MTERGPWRQPDVMGGTDEPSDVLEGGREPPDEEPDVMEDGSDRPSDVLEDGREPAGEDRDVMRRGREPAGEDRDVITGEDQ